MGKDGKVKTKAGIHFKQVVLAEEVVNLSKQLHTQLNQAKENLAATKEQVAVWDTRVKQITGSLATCNTLLQKRQKPTSLILESDNTDKEGKQ